MILLADVAYGILWASGDAEINMIYHHTDAKGKMYFTKEVDDGTMHILANPNHIAAITVMEKDDDDD